MRRDSSVDTADGLRDRRLAFDSQRRKDFSTLHNAQMVQISLLAPPSLLFRHGSLSEWGLSGQEVTLNTRLGGQNDGAGSELSRKSSWSGA
jgi:hypothetical protein